MPTWNKAKEHQQKIKATVIEKYGGECKCCGESRLVFLVIDHVDGGGCKERVKTGHGTQFYRTLIARNYPTGYQVLCHKLQLRKANGSVSARNGEVGKRLAT